MKRTISQLFLFTFPLLAGIAFLFQLSPERKFCYSFVKGECEDKASWIYHRVFERKENIEVAFSGASQTGCAIMDEYLEKELTKLTGNKIHAANLGYCRRGRDIQFVMVKDLFQQKKPKILVVEVTEDEPKKSHPVFGYLAETCDLWGSFKFFNQRYPVNLWKGLVVRFEYLKHLLFNNEYPVADLGEFGYRPSDQIVEPNIIRQNQATWVKRLSHLKSGILRKLELQLSKYYLKKIVAMAGQNNCRIVFLYLPESGSQLNAPLLADYYKSLGKLILLPEPVISDRLNWKDATHFNDTGAGKVSEFLAGELSLMLDE